MINLYEDILAAKRAALILNGSIDDYQKIKNRIEENNYKALIAVDGGANHLYKMGLVPDYIIGDMDSIEEEAFNHYNSEGCVFEKFPTRKSETDAELGVILAEKMEFMCLDIYASLGGRIDHEIANVLLLYYIQKKGIFPRIISDSEEIHLLENDELALEGKAGDIVSIIPIKGDAKGVTLRNLEYPLEEFDMEYSIPRGVSNVMLEDICYIDVRDGSILVIKHTN